VLGEVAGARDLLTRAGVTLVGAGGDADVALVACHGEVDRDRLDPLIRHGTSHVVVRLVDGAALVGPFVVPGLTACLRCIDAHQSIRDPDHVAVTSRYVRATSRPRADGMADLTDPVLATLALAWAVRDVLAHLDGRRPATWSRTLFLDSEPSRRREEDWSRHPECGCCWSAHPRVSGTIGG
jgi:bacteriocin biosynthesis cyclodehydratase domain-containing protein